MLQDTFLYLFIFKHKIYLQIPALSVAACGFLFVCLFFHKFSVFSVLLKYTPSLFPPYFLLACGPFGFLFHSIYFQLVGFFRCLMILVCFLVHVYSKRIIKQLSVSFFSSVYLYRRSSPSGLVSHTPTLNSTDCMRLTLNPCLWQCLTLLGYDCLSSL